MIKPGDTIVIEATANGWVVRNEYSPNAFFSTHDMHCFQHFEFDAAGLRCGPDSLFGFLLNHFRKSE